MARTSYHDLQSIKDDVQRWKDEDAEPFEARAALLARYHRADNDTVRQALLEIDSWFFDVTEVDNGPRMIEVAWR